MKNYFFITLAGLFLIACNDNTSKKTATVQKSMIEQWNKAHNSKDVGLLSPFYDNTIMFYGTARSRNQCLEAKLSVFQKNPDYFQQMIGEPEIEKISDSETKYSFLKRVTINQKTNDYPSYLILSLKGTEWKITTEGDLVTDKNLAKAKEIKIPKEAIKGDFNGDGVLDYAWLVPPKQSECGDCSGTCDGYIRFSDPDIPSIKIKSCIGGSPNNLGDLNKNGSDEIGILPQWCTSCWRSYEAYTFKNEKWINAVEPFPTHCNQWEQGINPIEIDRTRPGYVIIRYSEMGNLDLGVVSKSVPVN